MKRGLVVNRYCSRRHHDGGGSRERKGGWLQFQLSAGQPQFHMLKQGQPSKPVSTSQRGILAGEATPSLVKRVHPLLLTMYECTQTVC